jgi:hypothetical protein
MKYLGPVLSRPGFAGPRSVADEESADHAPGLTGPATRDGRSSIVSVTVSGSWAGPGACAGRAAPPTDTSLAEANSRAGGSRA